MLLTETHNVSAGTIDAHLTIVQGNIKNEDDVKKALTATSALPDYIIFGIGGVPKLQMSITQPATLDDPHVCADGMKTVLSALRAVQSGPENVKLGPSDRKPVLACISTTGVSNTRDVPLSIYPVYHWMLSVPHEDKKVMEKLLVEASREVNSPVESFTIVRPTLLMDGELNGLEKLREGWVYPDDEVQGNAVPSHGPELGYLISRADVGNWIFERVIKGNGEWNGKCASLTY